MIKKIISLIYKQLFKLNLLSRELFILLVMFTAMHANAELIKENALIKNSQQLIVITTAGWNAAQARGQRYARKNLKDKWQPVGNSFAMVVGKNGLAWDSQFAATYHLTGLIKQEGDQRSPAGIFPITRIFYFPDQVAEFQDSKMPLLIIQPATACIDDIKSRFYNQIIDTDLIKNKDWNSAEIMAKISLYQTGAVIGYNQKSETDKGSCIFLHLWRAPDQGTVGCSATNEKNLREILMWLDEAKSPLVAQYSQDAEKLMQRIIQIKARE